MSATPAVQKTAFEWFIALGSNLGDGRANLTQARRAIHAFATVVRASSIYESAPMYDHAQPRFYNAVVVVQTELNGPELLEKLQQVETQYGRVRQNARRYGPRAIDLDIVAGRCQGRDVTVDVPGLHIPHPRMHERSFVLAPLAEVVTQWQHPALGQSLDTLLENAGRDDSLRVMYRSEEWA